MSHAQDESAGRTATEVVGEVREQLPLRPSQPEFGEGIREVLAYVEFARGFGSDGYCPSVLERRIRGRLQVNRIESITDYLRLIEGSGDELDRLLDALTIKVSSFFRDRFAFEYLDEVVLPAIFANKAASGDRSVRVWSAGCANGEEPYTVAILLDALSRQEATGLEPVVFATDIDENALERGREALYSDKALGNVRLALLGSSFDKEGDRYRVRRDIAQCVSFSTHNLLDARTPAPSDSVFGTFDLILCRNVMIYFRPDSLHAACDRLHRSLATGGYLMLGTTERLPEAWRARYRRLTSHCTIYRKLPEGFDAQGNDASGRRSGPLGDAEGA